MLHKEVRAAKEANLERKREKDSDAKRPESEKKRARKEKLESMRARSQEMQERVGAIKCATYDDITLLRLSPSTYTAKGRRRKYWRSTPQE